MPVTLTESPLDSLYSDTAEVLALLRTLMPLPVATPVPDISLSDSEVLSGALELELDVSVTYLAST